jgi:hypothetical protein
MYFRLRRSKEETMSVHRSHIVKLAAFAIAISAALPALADDTVVVEKGNHHYTYYRDHDIYFSPDTRTYYWKQDGKWVSGPEVRQEDQRYISSGGVDIELDTAKPYERNDYVISHYQNGGPATQETKTTERTTSDNGATTTTTTTTTTKHKYVYYGDHDIYFSPDTRTYYWMADGKWQSGAVLPTDSQAYVRDGGVDIELDTARPYERNEYVIAHYKRGHDHDDNLKEKDDNR